MSVTWIEASAGTGKTYTLVQRVLGLVREGLGVERILLVTFTEKATAELKTRIRAGLRDEWKSTRDPSLAQALEDLASLSITTIHGFCRALLTQFPLESGVSFEPEMVDQGRQWRRLLREELRPRLTELDPGLLAWAGLEDEEDLLALAQEALERNVFNQPHLHPDAGEADRFEEVRRGLEEGRGPLWDAVALLRGTSLPEDARSAFGEDTVSELLHARNHQGPYALVRALAHASTWRDLVPLLEAKALAALERWREGGTVWKKAAAPPFTGTLEAVRTAAVAFADAARAVEAALAPGTALADFLEGTARWRVLSQLCLPVLEKRSNRELTFHDLIDRVHRLVTTPAGAALAAGAADRWHAVLIDEFQDTDREQWEIFSSLFLNPGHELVLVGDPKQSIYRFRGADLDLYRAARDTVRSAGGRFVVLGENFRSTAPMIDAVNRLFGADSGTPWENPDDFSPTVKGAKPVGQLVRRASDLFTPVPPVVQYSGDEKSWHRHLVETVLDLLDGTHFLDDGTGPVPLTPADVLVLVRRKNEAWTLHRLLTARGLPAVVGGSGGLLATREAREILLFLKALEAPRSLSAARALGWTRLFAGATVDQLSPALDLVTDDRDAGAYLRAFRRVAAALEPGVIDGGGLERLLSRPGGARIVTNAEHVLEVVQERHHRGEVPAGRAALSLETWMQSRLQEDEVDLRRDGETRTIHLMTIHAAKGLEAPVVLHGFPSAAKNRKAVWLIDRGVDWLNTAAGREAEQRQQTAEELRLRYVAWTRASTHQIMIAPGPGGQPLPAPPDSIRLWSPPPDTRPAVPDMGPPIDGLERRHPWVESHSGLWRRATRDEAETRVEWDRSRGQRDTETASAPEALAGTLPAGPVFGDLVHDILEAADFRGWAPGAASERREQTAALVAEHCVRHRAAFEGKDLTAALDRWLARVLPVPLGLGPETDPVDLTALAPEDTRRELEFHLPLALDAVQTFDWGGRIFTVHPGYLTGRIDLLFRWQGKLYLADWKTNRLADGQEPGDLMAEAGYDLQAQWYWEALGRLCRLQNEPLEPGGVLYVFLRGTDDKPRGVFHGPAELNAQTALSPFLKEARGG
jgi:exodeoxyribonuclease V beta subunit